MSQSQAGSICTMRWTYT